MKLISSILSIFTCIFCFGQSNWTYAATSASLDEYYVKGLKKTYFKDIYSLWVKTVYPEKKIKNKKEQWKTTAGSCSISSRNINYIEKKVKLDRVIDFDSKGKVIYDEDQFTGWEEIDPDSMVDAIYEYVCVKSEED